MNRKTIVWFIISVLFAGLLVGCGQSSLEVGMVETNLPGQWEASYTTFTGTKVETIRADAGQTLILNYEVAVDKGDLAIKVDRPEGGSLLDLSFQEDGQDTVEIAIGQDGRHTITIEGDNAGGGFDLSWKLE